MRQAPLAAAFALAAGVVLTPAGSAWAASDVFRGAWASVDRGDGSAQTLRIQGSGTGARHSVFVRDSVATRACGGGPANVAGTGTVHGDTLTWFFTVTCPGGGKGPVIGRVGPALFTYQPGTDTLIDDAGAVWHRVS